MITSREFGVLPGGEIVTAYDFKTEAGFEATILSYGATLQSLTFPDGTDIVLGFDKLDGYLGNHPHFGVIVGRVANRISDASFQIGEERFNLPQNEGQNNLHSGPIGFDQINWIGEIEDETLILRHISPNGYQGFPGEMQTELGFTFEESKLSLSIRATVDKPCPVKITYHPYFNLTDGGATACTDHQLQIHASHYSESKAGGIPTGELFPTDGGATFDYNSPQHVKDGDNLDQNFVIKTSNPDEASIVKMAKLSSDTTGHKVIICSTAPCLQAYTGAYIPEIKGKAGITYGANHGVALEPQSYPDAVNQKTFPSNILQPGEVYSHKINYTFRAGEARA